jgi:hypothetical protein
MSSGTTSPVATNLLSGFGGAVVGSLLAGAISWNLARQAGREAAIRDAAIKQDQQRAQAYRCLITAHRIASELISLKAMIDDSLRRANDLGMTASPTWTRVITPIGPFAAIEVDTHDLVVFMEAHEFEIVNDLIEVSMKHADINEAMKLYAQMRMQLMDHAQVDETNSDGGHHILMITEEGKKRLSAQFAEMESLLTTAISLLNRSVEKAKDVAVRIGPASRKYFNDPKFPKLTFPEQSTAPPESSSYKP